MPLARRTLISICRTILLLFTRETLNLPTRPSWAPFSGLGLASGILEMHLPKYEAVHNAPDTIRNDEPTCLANIVEKFGIFGLYGEVESA